MLIVKKLILPQHNTCIAGFSDAGQHVTCITGSAVQPCLGGASISSPVVFSQEAPHMYIPCTNIPSAGGSLSCKLTKFTHHGICFLI